MQLSPNFSLAEFITSETAARLGLSNEPDAEIIETLKATAARLEEVRSLLGCPIIILSGFRSVKVNSAVGGSSNSQHCLGEAVDFIAPQFGTPQEVCRAILDSTIEFDQLIAEGIDNANGGWCHIAFSDNPRRSVLTAHFHNGKAVYSQGVA